MAIRITNLLDRPFAVPKPVGAVLDPRASVYFADVSYTDVINDPRFVTMEQTRQIRIVNLETGYTSTTVTTADMNLWVAPTGSSTNDGTESRPYPTLTRAMEDVPFQVNHTVHIRIAAGTYTETLPILLHSFGTNGYLCVEGTGTPTQHAGPFSVTTFADGDSDAYNTVLVTGAGWTSNEFYGKWVRVTAGTGAGHLFPIHTNTADTIKFAYAGASSVGTITEIDIVDGPASTLEFEDGLCIAGTERNQTGDAWGRLAVGGVRFKTESLVDESFALRGLYGYFVFTVFQSVSPATAINARALVIQDSEINSSEPSGLFDAAQLEVNTMGGIQLKRGDAKFIGSGPATLTLDNSLVSKVTCPYWASFWGGYNSYNASTCGQLNANFTQLFMQRILFDSGDSTWVQSCIQSAGSNLRAYWVHFDDCAGPDAWKLGSNSKLDAYQLSCNASNVSGYALRVYAGSIATLVSVGSFTGTTNDMIFNQTAVANTWPASGNAITDSQGSFVIAPA